MPGVRITSLRPKREHLSPSDRCSLLFERQIPNLLASKANRLLWAFFTKRCRRQSKRVRKGAAVEILRQKERKFRAPQEAAEPKMPGGLESPHSNHRRPPFGAVFLHNRGKPASPRTAFLFFGKFPCHINSCILHAFRISDLSIAYQGTRA